MNTEYQVDGQWENAFVNYDGNTYFHFFKSRSAGLWRRVVLWCDTNVSEVHAASIFRVKWKRKLFFIVYKIVRNYRANFTSEDVNENKKIKKKDL
jgi:hypothetical protein